MKFVKVCSNNLVLINFDSLDKLKLNFAKEFVKEDKILVSSD